MMPHSVGLFILGLLDVLAERPWIASFTMLPEELSIRITVRVLCHTPGEEPEEVKRNWQATWEHIDFMGQPRTTGQRLGMRLREELSSNHPHVKRTLLDLEQERAPKADVCGGPVPRTPWPDGKHLAMVPCQLRPGHFGPCSPDPETEAAKARRDLVKSGKVDLYAPAYRVARPDLGPKLGPETAGPAKPELADCHCTKEDQPPIIEGSVWCCGRCGRVRKAI